MSDATAMVIADTHALLWHLTANNRLGQAASATLERVDNGELTLVIPALVLAEIYMVIEKGRLTLSPDDFTEALMHWQAAENIRLTDLTPELVMASRKLISIPDIFDRLIVAEARALGVPLITRDAQIAESDLVAVIW